MAAQKQYSKGFLKGFSIFFFVLAGIIGILTLVGSKESNEFGKEGINTTATITRVSENITMKQSRKKIILHVNYFTEPSEDNKTGELITTEITDFGYDKSWYDRKNAEIVYLPSEPRKAILAKMKDNNNLLYAGGGFALLFLLGGFGIFSKAKKMA